MIAAADREALEVWDATMSLEVPPTILTRAELDRRLDCAGYRLRRAKTEAEAAAYFNVHPATVRRWVRWALDECDDPRADGLRRLARGR